MSPWFQNGATYLKSGTNSGSADDRSNFMQLHSSLGNWGSWRVDPRKTGWENLLNHQ